MLRVKEAKTLFCKKIQKNKYTILLPQKLWEKANTKAF